MEIRIIPLVWLLFSNTIEAQSNSYPWLSNYEPANSIVNRIILPEGYERIQTNPGSFANWLQHLPLKAGCPPVYLFNGKKKSNQTAHAAVVDIDVGNRDLQQCADAVIRLRAEYLFSLGDIQAIHFNFTSGHRAELSKWFQGFRPEVKGNQVALTMSANADSSYRNFKQYLQTVFIYAGSYSLGRELVAVREISQMKIGDVFIQGGFPGHAVMVVDMAVHQKTGENIFLLVQSYMPAQEIHILKNPQNPQLSPWYSENFGDILYTPEWIFQKKDLKKFR